MPIFGGSSGGTVGPTGPTGPAGTGSGPTGPTGARGPTGPSASGDPSITSYRDTAVTSTTLGTIVRSVPMPVNSQLFLQVYAQYTSATGCGFTVAQNEFIRGTDVVSAAGATDIKSVNSVAGFVLLTATATGVDILVKSPSPPINWSLHTICDIG